MTTPQTLTSEQPTSSGRVPDLRYGMMLDLSEPLPGIVDQVRQMADGGITSALTPHVSCYWDALTLLTVAGREVPDIELVAGVVPILPHHPIWLAGQALTVQAAVRGRLTLGIGISGQLVVEGVYGLPYERPARRMREYLDVLGPLLRGEQVTYQGETVKAATPGPLGVKAPAPPLLVGALGPRMLELAGGRADGAITWLAGPKTVATHITPSVRAAAERAGRPPPRVHVILPMCVTDDPGGARDEATRTFGVYGAMPSYRAVLEREGAAGPADVAIIGDEQEVGTQIARLAEAGATDLTAVSFGSPAERRQTFSVVSMHAKGSSTGRSDQSGERDHDPGASSTTSLPLTTLYERAE